MSRKAREQSATGIYHVVIRGIDRQIMFNESKDYRKYLEILELYKEECGFEIYAYCLMLNHVHLIIHINEMTLGEIFRKINTHYAGWFNMKYQRSGHLQQGRFYSEPVNDLRQLLASIRYVHRNPCKAGMEKEPGSSYLWNSIYEYMRGSNSIVNTEKVLEEMPVKEFLTFNAIDTDDEFLDVEQMRRRIPDDVAKDIIVKETGCENIMAFQNLSLQERKKWIVILNGKGISIRQLNRLTGITIGVIQHTLEKGHTIL